MADLGAAGRLPAGSENGGNNGNSNGNSNGNGIGSSGNGHAAPSQPQPSSSSTGSDKGDKVEFLLPEEELREMSMEEYLLRRRFAGFGATKWRMWLYSEYSRLTNAAANWTVSSKALADAFDHGLLDHLPSFFHKLDMALQREIISAIQLLPKQKFDTLKRSIAELVKSINAVSGANGHAKGNGNGKAGSALSHESALELIKLHAGSVLADPVDYDKTAQNITDTLVSNRFNLASNNNDKNSHSRNGKQQKNSNDNGHKDSGSSRVSGTTANNSSSSNIGDDGDEDEALVLPSIFPQDYLGFPPSSLNQSVAQHRKQQLEDAKKRGESKYTLEDVPSEAAAVCNFVSPFEAKDTSADPDPVPQSQSQSQPQSQSQSQAQPQAKSKSQADDQKAGGDTMPPISGGGGGANNSVAASSTADVDADDKRNLDAIKQLIETNPTDTKVPFVSPGFSGLGDNALFNQPERVFHQIQEFFSNPNPKQPKWQIEDQVSLLFIAAMFSVWTSVMMELAPPQRRQQCCECVMTKQCDRVVWSRCGLSCTSSTCWITKQRRLNRPR